MNGDGRALRALTLLGVGLGGYALGRAPTVLERIERDAALVAAAPALSEPARPRKTIAGSAAVATASSASAVDRAPPAAEALNTVDVVASVPTARPVPARPGDLMPVVVAHRPVRISFGLAGTVSQPAAALPRAVLPTPALPLAAPPVAAAPAPPSDRAFTLATAAYAALASGDRLAAATGFDAALAAAPDAANAPLWQSEARHLRRRWSGQAWTLLRDGGGSLAAASPVLGGGQSGANLSYTLDPLARRPLALVARVAVPDVAAAVRAINVTQFALGVEWQPVRGVRLSAERLVAGGPYARNDFALRLGAGASGERARLAWSGYGEAGIIGLTRGDAYAGGEAKLGWHGPALGRFDWTAGGGAWGSAQWAGGWSTRLDAGPTLAIRLPLGRISLTAVADYRFRLAGNALPGSGPALTLATGF